jgi:deazaflavin-dependent oxidoreductase (nitroreductase family)
MGETADKRRKGMKLFMQLFMSFHVLIYRLTNGKVMGSLNGMQLLLLDTVGRKSGKARTNPLMYIRDGDDYVITASAGGAEKNPGWYYNLRANPRTSIQVLDRKFPVTATEASPAERTRLWAKLVAQAPQFKAYETKTRRTIPMMILKP